MKKLFSLIVSTSFLAIPGAVLALENDYPEFAGFKLILGMKIGEIIVWFYYFMVSIGGLAAFAMIIWGGVQWLTSTGNPSKISDAKDRISSAIYGLLLILGSWLILQTINPNLTSLNIPSL